MKDGIWASRTGGASPGRRRIPPDWLPAQAAAAGLDVGLAGIDLVGRCQARRGGISPAAGGDVHRLVVGAADADGGGGRADRVGVLVVAADPAGQGAEAAPQPQTPFSLPSTLPE